MAKCSFSLGIMFLLICRFPVGSQRCKTALTAGPDDGVVACRVGPLGRMHRPNLKRKSRGHKEVTSLKQKDWGLGQANNSLHVVEAVSLTTEEVQGHRRNRALCPFV